MENLMVGDAVEISACGISIKGKVMFSEHDEGDDFCIDIIEAKTKSGFNTIKRLFDYGETLSVNKLPKKIGGFYGKWKGKTNSSC